MTDAPALKRRPNNSAIFVCDLQEKFRPVIHEFDKVILTANKVLRAATALNIPTYFTTQNKARLGPVVADLTPHQAAPNCLVPDADKTLFSMWLPELTTKLSPTPTPTAGDGGKGSSQPDIVLLGIESHICITQTALDALRAGHRVYVLADGVSSCNKEEVPIALARLRAEGVTVTTSESWLYEVVGDAGAPEFKQLIGIVKDSLGETRNALQALVPLPSGGAKI
ncbi:Isochorismatase hydrolase [Cryphonectria parasitica EP155]|uniref:Isochorismatase hydrolase n=1 Tax=Cryphonectria parasitica (strain ATCC 38755 / EP155) TaxID=660469 RepID=A0A9P4YCL8_CRYP1|nr:Isochorismatase hydrolase [Cryphonectria parasitica EP155]KAF3770534.1 Isochorismatase hydrolase [Cryphonectria parasitica EP155]